MALLKAIHQIEYTDDVTGKPAIARPGSEFEFTGDVQRLIALGAATLVKLPVAEDPATPAVVVELPVVDGPSALSISVEPTPRGRKAKVAAAPEQNTAAAQDDLL